MPRGFSPTRRYAPGRAVFTTPNEARLRADVFLFIGKDLTKILAGLAGTPVAC